MPVSSRWVGVLVLVLCAGGCASKADRPLQLIAGQGPVYPAQAKAENIEGVVTVQYDVALDGRVVNARVIASEPADIFDSAALVAVRSWRFNAPRVAGEVQPAIGRVSTVAFKLAGADAYDDY